MRKRKTRYQKYIALRVSNAMWEWLCQQADATETNVSEYVRHILESPWTGHTSCPHCGFRFENEGRKQ